MNHESNEEIKAEEYLKELKSKVFEKDLIKSMDKIVEFSDEIKQKYPDYVEYRAYHFLIGSSPREDKSTKFDFPGEDSVLIFLEKLNNDLEEERDEHESN